MESHHTEVKTQEWLRKSMIMVNDSVSSTAATVTQSAKPLAPVKFRDFDIITLLGEGSFGKVFKVRHKESNELYAMKSM
jgi:serine/threonine protein kinase